MQTFKNDAFHHHRSINIFSPSLLHQCASSYHILFMHIRHTIQVTQTHASVLFIVWLLRQTILMCNSCSFHLLMQTFKNIDVLLSRALGNIWSRRLCIQHLLHSASSMCSVFRTRRLLRSTVFCARCPLHLASSVLSIFHACHLVYHTSTCVIRSFFIPFYYS